MGVASLRAHAYQGDWTVTWRVRERTRQLNQFLQRLSWLSKGIQRLSWLSKWKQRLSKGISTKVILRAHAYQGYLPYYHGWQVRERLRQLNQFLQSLSCIGNDFKDYLVLGMIITKWWKICYFDFKAKSSTWITFETWKLMLCLLECLIPFNIVQWKKTQLQRSGV